MPIATSEQDRISFEIHLETEYELDECTVEDVVEWMVDNNYYTEEDFLCILVDDLGHYHHKMDVTVVIVDNPDYPDSAYSTVLEYYVGNVGYESLLYVHSDEPYTEVSCD